MERNIDIIIPVYNCWIHTQACINSILNRKYLNSNCAYQIILVDNGSKDHTSTIEPGSHRNFWLFRTDKQLGYGGAINHYWRTDGHKFAKEMNTSHILLLNNDTLIHSDDWLTKLLDDMEKTDSDVIGLGHTLCDYTKDNPECLPTFSYIGGWCMLMPVEVWEDVGLFDEQFGIGFYEDKDWCFRAQEKGYKLAISHNIDIEHLNNTTFNAHPEIDKETIGRKNHNKFIEKWGFMDKPGDWDDHAYETVNGKRIYLKRDQSIGEANENTYRNARVK